MVELLKEVSEHTTILTINRPDKRNALNESLVERLHEEVFAHEGEDGRVLVLRGEGKNFSSGFDLSNLKSVSEDTLIRRFIRIETLLQAIEHAPFTTIAFAHGSNFGAGADLLVACDHRIAEKNTTFKFPGLRFGLVLGTGRLVSKTSREWANAVLRTGSLISANEAEEAGLLTSIAPKQEWEEKLTAAVENNKLLAPVTHGVVSRLTTHDTRDRDLSELVRSVSEPGLRSRINLYIERSRPTSSQEEDL